MLFPWHPHFQTLLNFIPLKRLHTSVWPSTLKSLSHKMYLLVSILTPGHGIDDNSILSKRFSSIPGIDPGNVNMLVWSSASLYVSVACYSLSCSRCITGLASGFFGSLILLDHLWLFPATALPWLFLFCCPHGLHTVIFWKTFQNPRGCALHLWKTFWNFVSALHV